MKIYVVILTEGDYLGWFQTSEVGVFYKEDDALKYQTELEEKNKMFVHTLTLEEVELQ